jgi:RNA polymerase sigma-70 factor (ECF subfamily)
MKLGELNEHDRLAEAFEQYSDALFRHCFFRLSDREKALDLTQEAFLKTWNYSQGGGQIEDMKAFLYRTLNNLVVDEYRKKKAVSLDAILEGEGVSEGDFEDLKSPMPEAFEQNLDAKRALALLERIPEKYRTAISLRYVDGLSPKEIADILGETENVVSVRIHRGLARLREVWDQK